MSRGDRNFVSFKVGLRMLKSGCDKDEAEELEQREKKISADRINTQHIGNKQAEKTTIVRRQLAQKPHRRSKARRHVQGGSLIHGTAAKVREQQNIQQRKIERSRSKSISITQTNPKSSERHEVNCGCSGEVENCPRCYGKGTYRTDGFGTIVNS